MLCLHGTSGSRVKSILSGGLVCHPKKNWAGYGESYDGVYFSVDLKRAISAALLAMEMDAGTSGAIVICDIDLKNLKIRLDEDELSHWLTTTVGWKKFFSEDYVQSVWPEWEKCADAFLLWKETKKKKHLFLLRQNAEVFLVKAWRVVDLLYSVGERPYFRFSGNVSFSGMSRITNVVSFGYGGVISRYCSEVYDEEFYEKVLDGVKEWLDESKFFNCEIYNPNSYSSLSEGGLG